MLKWFSVLSLGHKHFFASKAVPWRRILAVDGTVKVERSRARRRAASNTVMAPPGAYPRRRRIADRFFHKFCRRTQN